MAEWRKRLWPFGWLLGALCCVVLYTPPVLAVDGWQASYWNTPDLSGAPILVQLETDQNHNPELRRNWGTQQPWPTVDRDYFSARYERTLVLQPGRYRFAAAADDGVRVWLNGELLIDEWLSQVSTTHLAYYDQTAATPVTIRVEYFDEQHEALLTVTWDRIFGSDTAVTNEIYAPTISEWRGEYFNNRVVAGQPDVVRNDVAIDFDWGLRSPAIESINADGFSVRWSRTLQLEAGIWQFKSETDDGVRLYLNGRLVIDQWHNQLFSPHTTDFPHSGGPVDVQMEYYDELGLAQARLTWTKIGVSSGLDAPQTNTPVYWQGSYYNNTNLAASPAVVRAEQGIQFDWGTASPAPNQITREAFSARWEGRLDLPAGSYRFTIVSDDGARLWVNNQLLIDKWEPHNLLTYSADIELLGGTVPVVMTYYNAGHNAVAKLDWVRLDGELPENRGLVPLSREGGTPATAVSPSTGIPASAETVPMLREGPQATVTVQNLNVRTEPNILSEVQSQLDRHVEVAVLGRNRFNTWLQVALPDGRLGWVSVLYVSLPADFLVADFEIVANPTTAVPLDAEGGPFRIVGSVNSHFNIMRTLPNYLSDPIPSLARNTEVQVVGRNSFSNWIEIELPDGGTGWISVVFLTLDVPVSALPITAEAGVGAH